MRIKHGKVSDKYGPGVDISLTGDELATAIDAYLVARGVYYQGPRTTTVNGALCKYARVYVDSSGYVITPEGEKLRGDGGGEDE